jgi:hypothetical protein
MVTKEQIVQALRENHIRQTIGTEFRDLGGSSLNYIEAKTYGVDNVKMCALGKLRFKLEISYEELTRSLAACGLMPADIISMNDVRRMTFKQIADEIEKFEPTPRRYFAPGF